MRTYTKLYRRTEWLEKRGIQTITFTGLIHGEKCHETTFDAGPDILHPAGEVGHFRTKAEIRKALRSGIWSETPPMVPA